MKEAEVKKVAARLQAQVEAVAARLAPLWQARAQGGRWTFTQVLGWHLADGAGTILWKPEEG